MSQQQQSHTPSLPSWKLNLTQQFNQASSYKNNNNNNNNKHQNNNKNKPTINNFDQQLQQRLTNIIVSTNHHNLYKEQLSSQKSQQQQQRQRQRQTIKINNNNKKDKERNNNNINFNEHLMQPNSSNSQANSNTTNIGRNYNICYYDSIFTNDKVAKLFNKHFGNYNDDQKNKQIRLQQFVNILCMQYLGQQKIQIKQLQSKITNDIKKALVQECRLIFCTTDQHTISLNAIQLLTKKNDLKLIILQLLLKIKYQKRKQKLQLKYQKILQSIIQQQQQIQKQQQKLANKRHKVQAQQRQLKKMFQKIKLQQKQLVEREKQTKKFLQEKYNKLSQQLKQVYDKMYKQIEKKANAFQRNAKNKLELIEKRRVGDNKNSNNNNNNNNSNSKNTYNNNTNNNNEQPITSSITSANHKLNNELIIIKSKLKKAQNQLLSTKTAKDRQIKQLQNESNSLLKINTMLQSKLQKSKTRINELSQCIVKIQRQLQSYKQEVREKNRQVIKLQSQLLEKQHVISSNNIGNYYEQNNLHIQQKTQHKHIRDYALQQKYRENHQQGTMKLSYNNSNTNNINDNSNYVIGQQYQQQLTIITITNNTNHIVRLLMQAFNDDNHKFNDDNHKDSNNNITKVSSPSHNIINPTTTIHTTQTKIQQALINQSTDIIVACGNIFWSVVNHISQLKSQKQSSQLLQQQFYQKINISHLLEFVIKLFMAKFSFIKFQSLMIMRRENSDYPLVRKSQQQLEQFVEDVSTKTARGREGQQINNCFNLTMQQKIKATSIFMSLSQSSLQQQLYQQQNNLYQQKLQTHLNLYITLLILGINQTFNFKTGKLQPIIKKILNLLTNHMSSTYKFFVNKFYDQQLMTFLLWKYMSYGVGIGQVSTFMDVLIQLCNNTHQQYQQNITTTSTSNRLFKTIYALENYKCFINFLLLNFTQKHNLSKNNILLKQTLQKVSIILQRFCYCYRGKLNVIEEDIRRLRKIVKQISSNRQFDESMFKANMVSILQAIEQYNNQQEDQYHNEQ